MTNNIKKDIYLGHFGVKGMKWGVRQRYRNYNVKRNQKTVAYNKKIRASKYTIHKSERDLAKAIRWQKGKPKKADIRTRNVQIGIGLILYGAIAAYGALQISQIKQIMDQNKRANYNGKPTTRSFSVQDVINQERKTKLSALKRTYDDGFMDAEQYKTFKDAMIKRYDRKISESKLKKPPNI